MPTIEAKHPVRTGFGLDVHGDTLAGSCRSRLPEAPLLRTNFHVLLLCDNGSATQMVEFTSFRYRAGSLLWLPPGVVHERVPRFMGKDICFSSAFIGAELASVGGAWYLDGEDLEMISALWKVLEIEYHRYMDAPSGLHSRDGEALLRHLLIALIRRVQAVPAVRPADDAPNPLVRSFLRMIDERCGEMLSVDEYAKALGCSSRTLRRICHEEVGTPPRQIIDQKLAEAAQTLLMTTDLPLGGVARALGFSDSSNFSRFFRRETGLTPGAYRRMRGCPGSASAMLETA